MVGPGFQKGGAARLYKMFKLTDSGFVLFTFSPKSEGHAYPMRTAPLLIQHLVGLVDYSDNAACTFFFNSITICNNIMQFKDILF